MKNDKHALMEGWSCVACLWSKNEKQRRKRQREDIEEKEVRQVCLSAFVFCRRTTLLIFCLYKGGVCVFAMGWAGLGWLTG
jgi:hypothetical protein